MLENVSKGFQVFTKYVSTFCIRLLPTSCEWDEYEIVVQYDGLIRKRDREKIEEYGWTYENGEWVFPVNEYDEYYI
jgi:hypothetical protein